MKQKATGNNLFHIKKNQAWDIDKAKICFCSKYYAVVKKEESATFYNYSRQKVPGNPVFSHKYKIESWAKNQKIN